MSAVLKVVGLCKSFGARGEDLQAVREVSFQVEEGQCFGIVGESGSGKSTVARMIMGLLEADDGDIFLDGESLERYKKNRRDWYRKVQMVFQTPVDSFNPRITLGKSIMSPMIHYGWNRQDAKSRMEELLRKVRLPGEYSGRYPGQVSGGECQRAAIARAVGVGPRLLICDEATSALDVSVQAEIVELLRELQRDLGLTVLFISHDLGLVQEICQEMAVMHEGGIVEQGETRKIIKNPRQDYTKTLIESVLDCPLPFDLAE